MVAYGARRAYVTALLAPRLSLLTVNVYLAPSPEMRATLLVFTVFVVVAALGQKYQPPVQQVEAPQGFFVSLGAAIEESFICQHPRYALLMLLLFLGILPQPRQYLGALAAALGRWRAKRESDSIAIYALQNGAVYTITNTKTGDAVDAVVTAKGPNPMVGAFLRQPPD